MIYTIYGKPKVGKTTFSLKGAPRGKTAIINADDGLIGTDTSGFTVINDVSVSNLNREVLSPAFLKSHTHVVVDTATALHEHMLHAMSGGKTPTLSMWGAANQALATLIRGLKGESRKVIILCQEKLVAPTEDWVSEDDDEEVIASVTLDLPQGAARSLITMSDCIGRLYIANVNGKYRRRLWLTPTPGVVAGARSAKYKGRPPFLPNPSVERLDSLLGWTKS